MKRLIFILVIIMMAWSGFAEKAAVLPELLKPETMAVDDNNLYVTQEAQVFIYSLNDFKLIKKFGRKGEGPEEFPVYPGVPLILRVEGEHLLVNSPNRISYFTKQGEYVKMIKSKGGSLISIGYQPIKDRFVGTGFTREEGLNYVIINLFDAELRKIKTIHKVQRSFQDSGPIKLFSDTAQFQTYKDKIYFMANQEFVIDVLDINGKPIFQIKRDCKRVRFTEDHEKEIFENVKADPRSRPYFEMLKQRMVFPKYFPAIAAIFLADDLLHVLTWKRDGDKFECFIYDDKGALEDQIMLNFQFQASLQPYPAAFKNKKLYQLVENPDEDWELHITPYR